MNRLNGDRGESSVGAVLAVLAALVVVVIVGVGVWQFGWFVKEKDTDKQVQIDNRNTGTQTAWHDQAKQGIKDFKLLDPSNTAQRGAIKNQVCDLIPRLTDPYRDDDIVAFQKEYCS